MGEKRIAFIGGGQMASALLGGLIDSGRSPAVISVVDPSIDQREKLVQRYGVGALACVDDDVRKAEVVIWCVKPQVLREVIGSAGSFSPGCLHISIAAGVRLAELCRWTGSQKVVRAMPNTAALVGSGVTGLAGGASMDAAARALAEDLLAATGHCFWLESDERIDAVTAVSGSGPAYVFHFLEAFQAAAQRLGFGEAQARDLVLKTAAGAVRLASQGETPFSTLREQVTSKRGTTEAALEVLNSHQTARALDQALQAAYTRAGELSEKLASSPLSLDT